MASNWKLTRAASWLALSIVLGTSLGCNPGQCLRQSDCPDGSTCKKGVCKVPKSAASAIDAGGRATPPTPNVDTTFGPASAQSSSSTTFVSDAGTAISDATDETTNSAQSSNLDSTSDTSSTLSQ